MMDTILSIKNLSKTYYGKKHNFHKLFKMTRALERDEQMAIRAVDNVSLEVRKGEIFGLLGSNGAGKSTLLKMLCGLTNSDSGEITLLGEKVTIANAKIKENIGALIEYPVFFTKMSARRNLQYLGVLNGNVSNIRIEEMAELFDIKSRLDENMNTYSLGMYQKIGVMQAIMHQPQLLILDEPTNGLDPKWIAEVREIFKVLARKYGMTIIISSHILGEMQELCDRVAIIDKGKIVKTGTMAELLNTDAQTYSDIEYSVSDALAAAAIASNYNARVLTKDNQMLVRIEKDMIASFNRDLILGGVMINSINVRQQKLEDVFRQATSVKTESANSSSSIDNLTADSSVPEVADEGNTDKIKKPVIVAEGSNTDSGDAAIITDIATDALEDKHE